MRIRTFTAVAVAMIALGAWGHQARADLITNGGFEFPPIDGFYANYGAFSDNPYAGPGFQGWTVTTNNVDLVNPLAPGAWNALAYEGQQLLDLVGYGNSGGIKQTFDTLPGQQYLLSFAFGNNPGSTSSASAAVAITGTGSLLSATIFHNTSAIGNLNWNLYSGSFVANSASTTLSFDTIFGTSNGGILLDSVSVSAIPEPATWAMMILGFATLALVAYGRSRKSSAAAASA